MFFLQPSNLWWTAWLQTVISTNAGWLRYNNSGARALSFKMERFPKQIHHFGQSCPSKCWSRELFETFWRSYFPATGRPGALKPLCEASGEGLSLKFGSQADRIPEKSDSASYISFKNHVTLFYLVPADRRARFPEKKMKILIFRLHVLQKRRRRAARSTLGRTKMDPRCHKLMISLFNCTKSVRMSIRMLKIP